MNTLVAIPSAVPGGMEASIDAHFGHCGLCPVVPMNKAAAWPLSTIWPTTMSRH